MSIESNIESTLKKLENYDCQLIAVSKTKPLEMLQEAYDAGMRHFGENKVQEMSEKHPQLAEDILWHQIGHLQTNKVKYIAPFVHLIHAVDSLKLLKEINKRAAQNDRVIDCLLQIHIAQEDTKFGLSEAEAADLLASEALQQLQNISIKGLMGMATNTDDSTIIRAEFKSLRLLKEKLASYNNESIINLKELSMGMSSDYMIAADEGSTMVRVGSSIFGARNYAK